MEREPVSHDQDAKLYEVVGIVAAFWTFANLGYYFLLPMLGYSLDYNLSPAAIGGYFLAWSLASFAYFWRLFRSTVHASMHLWAYGALSLGVALLVTLLLYTLSFFPALTGPALAPYTDLIFVTPWYFLPKSIEVLFQQILITTLILEFYARTGSLRAVQVLYALTFVGAHIALFGLSTTILVYSVSITLWALASTWVFPRLILRARGGFLYAYAIHLISYIVLAMLLHTWPPPGYLGL